MYWPPPGFSSVVKFTFGARRERRSSSHSDASSASFRSGQRATTSRPPLRSSLSTTSTNGVGSTKKCLSTKVQPACFYLSWCYTCGEPNAPHMAFPSSPWLRRSCQRLGQDQNSPRHLGLPAGRKASNASHLAPPPDSNHSCFNATRGWQKNCPDETAEAILVKSVDFELE